MSSEHKAVNLILIMMLTLAANAQKKDPDLVLSKIQGQRPRNIIFILTDDHRYDFMGFTGLQMAGYQTSFFGKWHMGNEDDRPRPGFTHWESFKGQGDYYNPTLNIDSKEVNYSDSTYITDLLTEHALRARLN